VQRIKLKAGDFLYSEGDTADRAFLLLEGEIAFFQSRERVMDVQRGRFFGDLQIFKKGRYPATAAAVTDAVVLAFDGEEMLDHLMEDREKLREYLIDVEDRAEALLDMLMRVKYPQMRR
jgi:CRP-like cAMP-binding protein